MARSISVYRRKPNLIDLFVRQRPNVAAYRFKAGTNFDDASPTLFQIVPSAGYKSLSVPDDIGFVDSQFRGCTRFTFNPADYTVAVPAVSDLKNLWIKIAPVSTSGAVGPDESYHLVLPSNLYPQRSVVISGIAPNVGSLTSSLELQLPMLCNNWEFQVTGSVAVFVAFESNGAEWQVNPLSTYQTNFSKAYENTSQIFVRGNGGTSAFTAIFSQRNNPLV